MPAIFEMIAVAGVTVVPASAQQGHGWAYMVLFAMWAIVSGGIYFFYKKLLTIYNRLEYEIEKSNLLQEKISDMARDMEEHFDQDG